MTTLNNNTHPIFEADQVLTSDHLNEMFSYLEEQERMTRAKLVGSGIVCGLDVRLGEVGTASAVIISNGTGLTSNGSLVVLEAENIPNTSITYPYFTVYEEPNEEGYSFFQQAGRQIELFELQTQAVAGAELLANLDHPLSSYGVLLYLECFDKKLKNCIENDCNEKGVERIFTLRKLLVSKSDLRNIICQEQELNVPKSEQEIDEHVNARFYLSPLEVPRFRTEGKSYFTHNQLLDTYFDLITETALAFKSNLRDLIKFLHPILQREGDLKSQLNNFLANLPANFREAIQGIDPCDVQYNYDFFCDAVATYNELIEATFDLYAECCPPIEKFPKHLRLGALNLVQNCKPSPYRTCFTQSPIHNHQEILRRKVIDLVQKLALLLVSFRSTKGVNQIKITPSVALSESLSKSTIPFYYGWNDLFIKSWNPELSRRCRQLENLSYHANQYAKLDHVRNPLSYSLDKYDFFRIEGHMCRNYQVAMNEIINLTNDNNLPFKVTALRLGSDIPGTELEKVKCKFNDLEILCEAWKSELECLFGMVIRQLTKVSFVETLRGIGGHATETAASTSGTNVTSTSITEINALTSTTKRLGSVKAAEGAFGTATSYGARGVTPRYDPEYAPRRVFDKVTEQIAVTEETLGSVLLEAMKLEGNIASYYTVGTEIVYEKLQAVEGGQALSLVDTRVGFVQPYQLATELLGFANAIDRPCEELDIENLQRRISSLNQGASAFLSALHSYRAQENRKVNIDFEVMIRIVSLLLGNCSFETLKEIHKEMELRKAEIMQMSLFSEFVKKHPGINHRGGVPKGGTFILVYKNNDNSIVSSETGLAKDNTDTYYLVSGKISDINGQLLIGAAVFVKGMTQGTVVDLDGRFSLQVPLGNQTLIISYAGYENIEIPIVKATVFDIRMAPKDDLSITNGIVVADFYLPYICCSDCPPIAYVLPPKEEVEEKVSLNLVNKSFCVPTGGVTYAFIVIPDDGKVVGEGVIQNNDGKYVFNPDQVEFGTSLTKQISFHVNEEEVPLKVFLEKKPNVEFQHKIEWRPDQFDGQLKPFIDLKISNYEHRDYQWIISIFLNSGKKIVLINRQHDNAASSRDTNSFVLNSLSEGTKIEITLKGQGILKGCKASNSKQDNIPKLDSPKRINFQVMYNNNQMRSPYRFSQGLIGTVSISVSPLGYFIDDNDAKALILRGQIGQDEISMLYQFKPIGKHPGIYRLSYKTGNLLDFINIEITGSVTRGDFKSLTTIRNFTNDSRITEILETESKGLENTINVVNALSARLASPVLANTVAEGGFNENFANTMLPAMAAVSSKIVAINIKSTIKNSAQQRILLDVYTQQLNLLLELIVVQDKDISSQSILSKMITQVGNQIKKMKAEGVKVNSGQKLQKTITQIAESLREKPTAQKRFQDLINKVVE